MKSANSEIGKVAVLGMVLLLGACNGQIPAHSAVTASAPQIKPIDIFPDSLKEGPSIELGDFILLLMPPIGESIDWDYHANGPIKWQTAPYTEADGADVATRTGWVRINIEGKTASILRGRLMELGWTITYSNAIRIVGEGSTLPPKFGVQSISLGPGGDGDSICFGTGFTGCDFGEPIFSVVKAGIHIGTICSKGTTSGRTTAWLMTYPGRQPTVMVWSIDGGSGGQSSSLTLKLNAGKTLPEWALKNDKDALSDPGMYGEKMCSPD